MPEENEEWGDEISLDTSLHLPPGNCIVIDTEGFIDEFNALAVRYDAGLNLWYLDRHSLGWRKVEEIEGEVSHAGIKH